MSLFRNQIPNPSNLSATGLPETAGYRGVETAGSQTSPEVHAHSAVRAPDPAINGATVPVNSKPAPDHEVIPIPHVRPQDNGFDDLESGYGSFPTVKLDGDQFFIDNEPMGKEFQAVILSVKKKFIWKATEMMDAPEKQLRWSYDNMNTTKGEPLISVVSRWQAEGYLPRHNELCEAMAEIQAGAWVGKLVVLNIPPQSKLRLGGYKEVLQMQKHMQIPEVITRVFVDKPVTTKGNTFRPWGFDFVQEVPRQ